MLGCQTYCISDSPSNRYCLIGPIISASLMFECVMMWNYILEEGLEDWDEDDYGFYGLPLFKATAVKYGWDNPIGEDSGRERKYDSQY